MATSRASPKSSQLRVPLKKRRTRCSINDAWISFLFLDWYFTEGEGCIARREARICMGHGKTPLEDPTTGSCTRCTMNQVPVTGRHTHTLSDDWNETKPTASYRGSAGRRAHLAAEGVGVGESTTCPPHLGPRGRSGSTLLRTMAARTWSRLVLSFSSRRVAILLFVSLLHYFYGCMCVCVCVSVGERVLHVKLSPPPTASPSS